MVQLDCLCFMEGKYIGNICNVQIVQCVMILVISVSGVEGIFAAIISSLNHSYCLSKLLTLKRQNQETF